MTQNADSTMDMPTAARLDPTRLREKFVDELRSAGFEPLAQIGDPAPPANPVRGRLGIGLECLDRQLWELPPALPALKQLGINFGRIQSGWALTEQRRGVYDFEWLDKIIDSLFEIGVEPWLSFSYGNPLYADPGCPCAIGGIGHIPLNTPEATAAWLRYVGTAVRRYRSRIKVFEVWNEPNCRLFFPSPEGDWAERYVKLTELTSRTIRENAPEAQVAACTGDGTALNADGVGRLLELGIGKHIDIYCFHAYTATPERNNAGSKRVFYRLFDRYAPGVALWRGEAGMASWFHPKANGALSNLKTSEKIQLLWMARHLISDLGDPRIELTSYFHLYDFLHYSREYSYYYGVLRKGDYSPKPAFQLLRLIKNLFDTPTVPEPDIFMECRVADDHTPESVLTNVETVTFSRHGEPIFAYWYKTGVNESFAPVGVNFFCWLGVGKSLCRPVVLDPVSGAVYRGPTAENPRIPLTNYPLVLTGERVIDGLSALSGCGDPGCRRVHSTAVQTDHE